MNLSEFEELLFKENPFEDLINMAYMLQEVQVVDIDSAFKSFESYTSKPMSELIEEILSLNVSPPVQNIFNKKISIEILTPLFLKKLPFYQNIRFIKYV